MARAAWVHGGGFDGYHQARAERLSRLEELRRRWDEQHAKLKALVLMYKAKAAYNDGLASRYQAALTRLRMFEQAGPPQQVPTRAGSSVWDEDGSTALGVVPARAGVIPWTSALSNGPSRRPLRDAGYPRADNFAISATRGITDTTTAA